MLALAMLTVVEEERQKRGFDSQLVLYKLRLTRDKRLGH